VDKTAQREFSVLYSTPNVPRVIKSRRMRWAGHAARREDRRGAYGDLMWRHDVRGPLGRSWRRWEDNIKTDL